MESTDLSLAPTETPVDSLTMNVETSQETNQIQETCPMANFNMVLPHGEIISLKSVSLMENISFLKQNLSEFFESCAYTCFSFEFRPENGDAYLLSDFAELNAYFSNFDEQTLTLHVIPQLYDSKSAKMHVKRIREILSYPPHMKGTISKSSSSDSSEVTKEKTLEEMKADIERVKAALPTDGEIFKPNSVSLQDYYQEVLYRVSENPDSASQNSSSPSDLIRSIFFSGWNPPPPQRRLRGDLFYLEVQFSIPNTPPLHITAQSNGFYINKSTTTTFDPTPAASASYSHELLETLIASSPAISQAWAEVSRKIDEQTIKALSEIDEDIVSSRANALESVAALYAQGRGDLVAQVPEWTFRPLEGNRRNKNGGYDIGRSQDDLCDCFGMDEKGALREWNEEIQTIRHLPTKDISEYLMKARYSHRITQEFIEACKVAIVAICNGHIVPVNPMDEVENQVYLYNNIFFSRPVDVRETFKVSQGDDACRKIAGHDLKNQKLIQALNIDNLHTVLTVIIDYKGQRWIGQSIIPGILQASENAARLMFGVLEDGSRMKCKTDAFEIMKVIGDKLSLTQRNIPAVPKTIAETRISQTNDPQTALLGFLASGESQSQIIRVDDLDEVVPSESATIPHIGPLEGKILRGSDGRLYALEMTRLAPRDANYVKTRGTEKINESELETLDQNICVTYVLRDELIQSYKQTKTLQMRQEEMMKTLERINEENNEKKDKLIQESETNMKPDEVSPEMNPAEKLFSPEVLQRISSIQMEVAVNPNVFLHTPSDIDEKVIDQDEKVAKDIALFLWDRVLPNITDLVRVGEAAPYDGKTLTEFLHNSGVNMRYLGELSRRARDEEEIDHKTALENQKRKNPMPFFWQDLLEVEIIARGMKHILNKILCDTRNKIPVADTISHLFNLLLGNGLITKELSVNEFETKTDAKTKKKGSKKSTSIKSPSLSSRVSSVPLPEAFQMSKSEFWFLYKQVVFSRFRHCSTLLVETPVDSSMFKDGNPFTLSPRLSKLSIVRRICQLCGIRISCKEYDWSIPTPFHENDIQDVVPLVKTCEPDTPVPEAKVFLDEAKLLLQQGNVGAAFERAQDASKYVSQVVGPVHSDTSRALSIMYAVLLRIGDMKSALSSLTKKLTVDVQLHGLDSAETLQNHLNMSVIYQEVGNYLAAASHIRSAVYILRLLCGDQHPEIASIYLRLSGIYNEVGNYDLSFKCLKIAKELVYMNGDQGTHALICQSMAGVFAQLDNFKDAIALQKECYVILRQLFGENDGRTADAKVRFEILIRKSAERNEPKAEREKPDKQPTDSLWLDDDFGAKSSKKAGKGKKGKKK